MGVWRDLIANEVPRSGSFGGRRSILAANVSAGEERSHYGRFRPEPVVHPGEPPVDGDAVRTLHSF